MAKISYKNRATGKAYSGDSKDVEILKNNPVTKDAFVFESVQEKPNEPETSDKAK